MPAQFTYPRSYLPTKRDDRALQTYLEKFVATYEDDGETLVLPGDVVFDQAGLPVVTGKSVGTVASPTLNSWQTLNSLTVWSHLGVDRTVRVAASGSTYFDSGGAGASYRARTRLRISLDGGSTWGTSATTDGQCGNVAGAVSRLPSAVTFFQSGTATGNIVVVLEYWLQSGYPGNIQPAEVTAHAIATHT